MKPYRGTLLAVAVLLATLPLSSCGDADDYAQTGGITLTSQATTMIVKHEMIFTVAATFPTETTTTTTTTAATTPAIQTAVINGCDTTLQYQAEGAGMNHSWREISGNTVTRTFMLGPRETGTLAVIARGKCIGSTEDWKYSAQVNVEVTEATALDKPTVSLEANPSSVVKGNSVTYILDATIPDDCTLNLMYQYSGAGFGVTTVNPAGIGQFILTPPAVGTLSVTAKAWCTQNPTAYDVKTSTVTVTETVVTITTPNTPIPPAVTHGAGASFTSGGAICSNGDTVQYLFTATGSPSGLVSWGAAPVTLTWPMVPSGGPHVPYSATVSVQARCENSPAVTSSTVTTASFTVN